MSNIPYGFSKQMMPREKIAPEEFDSWVRYVQEVRYKEEKRKEIEQDDEPKLQIGDIKVMVFLFNHNNDASDPPDGANAEIEVTTQLRDDGWYRNDITLKFASIFPAIETFEDYTKFKNACVNEESTKEFENNWNFYTQKKSFALYNPS